MATCIGSVPVRGWQRCYLATAAGKNSSEIGFSAESRRRRHGRRYLYRTPRYWRAPFACAARGLSLRFTCGRRRYAILSAHIKYLTRCLLPSREALTVTSTKCGLNFCSDSMNEGLASSAEEVYYRRQSR